MPSSPTVAWRMSSKNVQSPSLKSDAICFPVLTRASADDGGIDLRFARFLYVLPKPPLASLPTTVDDRDNVGSFVILSESVTAVMAPSMNGLGYDLLLSFDDGVNKESVRVCRELAKTRCCGFLGGFAASFSIVDAFSGLVLLTPASVLYS